MKRSRTLLCLSLLCGTHAFAQLQIGSGAYWNQTSIYTVACNIDLVDNGQLSAGTGTVVFSGNSNNSLSGSSVPSFYQLQMAKTGTASVQLRQDCNILQDILFTSGLLDLNSHIISLSPTAFLMNENEASRITGAAGGYVTITTNLNAPAGANPGNLGALITTTRDLGLTTIRRGHQPQQNSAGGGTSINRYFDIAPSFNTALNATLRISYFDAELNGLDENSLDVWKDGGGNHWTDQGFAGRNTTTNYVDRDAVSDFSRWTLSSPNNPLPVTFTSMAVQCNDGKATVHWQTALEQNSQRFEVQRSADGRQWQAIGSTAAAGNSSVLRDYSFDDPAPMAEAYYRVAEIDLDGQAHYSIIGRSACHIDDWARVWPNPFTTAVSMQLSVQHASSLQLRVYDQKGACVAVVQQQLNAGINQVSLPLERQAAGLYRIVAQWDNGSEVKTFTVVKQ